MPQVDSAYSTPKQIYSTNSANKFNNEAPSAYIVQRLLYDSLRHKATRARICKFLKIAGPTGVGISENRYYTHITRACEATF